MLNKSTNILILTTLVSLVTDTSQANDIEECDLSHYGSEGNSYAKFGRSQWLDFSREVDHSADDSAIKPCEFNLDVTTAPNRTDKLAYFKGQHENIGTDFTYRFSLQNLSSSLTNLSSRQYIKFFSIDNGFVNTDPYSSLSGDEILSLQVRAPDNETWEIAFFWHGQLSTQKTVFSVDKNRLHIPMVFHWHKDVSSNIPQITMTVDHITIVDEQIFSANAPTTSKLGLIEHNFRLGEGNRMYFGSIYN